jgi:signal transduction histidine kinase
LHDPTPEVKICFYRVLQEALTNVAKHANASQVRIWLNCDEKYLSLLVEDNGEGFTPQMEMPGAEGRTGMGLLGMRERLELLGGGLEIGSRPGLGTRLFAFAPYKEDVT